MSKIVIKILFILLLGIASSIIIPVTKAEEPPGCIPNPYDPGYCDTTQPVTEPVPAPPIIVSAKTGDLGNWDLDQQKTEIIPDLTPNATYVWKESKLTQAFLNQFREPYAPISSRCIIANEEGKIENTLGPYQITGIYRLEIYQANPATYECKPIGNSVGRWEFSVGGKTNIDCCAAVYPIYDIGKDVCKRSFFAVPNINNPNAPPQTMDTQCKQNGSYCEPDSLKCFQTKSLVQNSKICLDPEDPKSQELAKSDPAKYTLACTFAGGKKIKGCTDQKGNPGIATAIGCIHTNPPELIKDFMTFIVGISGGLAFLMMLAGAFQMLTSAGNPETINAGRSRLTSAVIGLLIVIFSILLLQIIGVDILRIPGFGKQP